MRDYLIIIEKTKTGFSAYSPDVPGCVATGKTRDQVKRKMRSAIDFHLKALVDDGLPIPKSDSKAEYITVGDY